MDTGEVLTEPVGEGEAIYRVRAALAHVGANEERTPDETGWVFALHCLAISDLVVELVEAERRGDCQDLEIETEPPVWRHYLGRSGQSLVLKPDLGVRTSVNSAQLVWFVEVDRATEGLRRIRGKASQYLDYWRSGSEQQRPDMQGAFPRVLWSVPDGKRAEALRRTLAQLPDPAGAMFVVETAQDTARALLGRPTNRQPTEGGEA